MIKASCPMCDKSFSVRTGDFNRASKLNAPRYCGRLCAGLARRKNYSADEKRAMKREYDRNRRIKLAETIKAQKAAYYQRTKDPVLAAQKRKERMPLHVEYCRRPEYIEWKRDYDIKYRAKKEHGEFWESSILALQIRKTCLELCDDTEIRRQNGTLNKHQNRRREYDRLNSNRTEIGPLGDA